VSRFVFSSCIQPRQGSKAGKRTDGQVLEMTGSAAPMSGKRFGTSGVWFFCKSGVDGRLNDE